MRATARLGSTRGRSESYSANGGSATPTRSGGSGSLYAAVVCSLGRFVQSSFDSQEQASLANPVTFSLTIP